VPFVSPGPGLDPDAWRIVNASRSFVETGTYTISRFPGYPVVELGMALVGRADFPMHNLLTALVTSFGAVALFALLYDGRTLPAAIGAATFTFVPVVYIASATSMDYLWAASFLIGAMYFAATDRPLLAGLCLGLATGCRITSAAMLLPAFALVWSTNRPRRARINAALILVAAWALSTTLCFIPVLMTYGLDFFTFYEPVVQPDPATTAARATLEVWGVAGTVALVLAVGAILWPRRGRERPRLASPLTRAALLGIAIYLVAFLRLPMDAAYLIPVAMLVTTVIYQELGVRAFAVFAALVVVSSFVGVTGSRLVAGPILQNNTERAERFTGLTAYADRFHDLPAGSVVVAASRTVPLEMLYEADHDVTIVYSLTADEYAELDAAHRSVFVLPGVNAFNRRVHHVDIAELGAEQLEATSPR
jgi:MFS family permease